MRFKNPQTPARAHRRRHRARRPVPADPPRRRPGALPGASNQLLARDGPAPARPRLHRANTPTASRTSPRPRRAELDWDESLAATGPARASRSRNACAMVLAVRARSSCAGRWASPSTSTPCPPSARSSTSCCCAATSAGPARACARCAATPTCRATAPWASSRSPPGRSSTRWTQEFGFDAAARPRLRRRRRDPRHARRRGRGLLRAWAATSSRATPDTEVTEAAHARVPADRARVHQAQPLPRGHRRARR